MDTTESSATHAHSSTAYPDRPHACYEGVVFIGHLVENLDTGEETEIISSVPCRRCAAAAEAR